MFEQLTNISLSNRFLIIVLAVLVMAGGIWCYYTLPIDAFPDISPNLVQVFTVTEGLAPEEIEKYVTYPVEAAMTGLPGVNKVRSSSSLGLSAVNIYFEDGMDLYFCRQLVNERLQEAREQIPEGFGMPEIGPISSVSGRVLYYYLDDTNGKYTLEELRTIQDWIIKPNLETVPGVTEVLGIGGFVKQYQVVVQPETLLRYNLTLSEMIQRIEENNLNVGAQFIEKNGEQLAVRSVGLVTDINDLRNIVVKTEKGRSLNLSDVADIRIGGQERQGLQTRNGQGEVVAAQVIRLYGTNASTIISRVEQKLSEIEKILPNGIKIIPYYQQRDLVQASVKTVRNALLQGIVLVTVLLLLFMGGFRASIAVILAIPFSILFAFIGMHYFHISANLMSLGGLAIAIGMIVDGTIVIIESMDYKLRTTTQGSPKLHLYEQACREVVRPVAFAITVIIIVFIPLFTLQGIEGKTFRPLAHTVAIAMLGSLIFAILLAPAFGSLLMRRNRKKNFDNGSAESLVVRILLKPYKPLVTFFVRFRWLALVLAIVLLAAGVLLFPMLGSEFTPELKEGTIVVRLTMAPSLSLNEGARTTTIVERKLMKIPEVREVVTRIGRGEVGADTDPMNIAEMYVLLKPKSQWRHPGDQESMEEIIRSELGEVPGALVNLAQPIQMEVDELLEGVKADLAIKLFGDDLGILAQKADEIADVVRTVHGTADLQVDQLTGAQQLLIRPVRAEIARYGLNVSDVQNVIHAAVGGSNSGQVFEGVRRFDIQVRYTPQARDTEKAIRNIIIPSADGKRVPLDAVADVREVAGARQITREDNQRFISVQCNVVGRDIGSFVAEAQEQIDKNVKLPPGYGATWGGQFRLEQEANRRLTVIVPMVLLIVFLLLFGNFHSVRSVILILMNIPLALVGGVIALLISKQNLSVPASVGFIALFGIALENGMVLVTYLNQLMQEGFSTDEASILGACRRVRPVLMTAATTALGLIPLLLATGTGSEVQRPLAAVVIGGLVTSTIITLIVLPALYKWFAIRTVKS